MGPEVSYHGFKLQRHISDEATVITYKAADGRLKRMAVLDAKHRCIVKFGMFGRTMREFEDFNFGNGAHGSRYIAGTSAVLSDQPMPDYVCNETIFANWGELLKSDKSARENCDIWWACKNYTADSQGTAGVPAVSWCRNKLLDGEPCDLGNVYEVFVIWACGDKLDEMDVSRDKFPGLKLGYTATNASYPGQGRVYTYGNIKSASLMSSTNESPQSVYGIGNRSETIQAGKHIARTVVPILELD